MPEDKDLSPPVPVHTINTAPMYPLRARTETPVADGFRKWLAKATPEELQAAADVGNAIAIGLAKAHEQQELPVALRNVAPFDLRDVLKSIRPEGHDTYCDQGAFDPDLWIDDTKTQERRPEGRMQEAEWREGVGVVLTGKTVEDKPYVGWCCLRARQRFEIDTALLITEP